MSIWTTLLSHVRAEDLVDVDGMAISKDDFFIASGLHRWENSVSECNLRFLTELLLLGTVFEVSTVGGLLPEAHFNMYKYNHEYYLRRLA